MSRHRSPSLPKISWTIGDLVCCEPANVHAPGLCLGIVQRGGSREACVIWESGLRQRLRGGALAQIRRLPDDFVEEAIGALARHEAARVLLPMDRPQTERRGRNTRRRNTRRGPGVLAVMPPRETSDHSSSQWTTGDLVCCEPDTGCASPGLCFGIVQRGGRREAYVIWESGQRQRLRGGALAQIRRLPDVFVEEAIDALCRDEAARALLGERVPSASSTG